MATTPQDKPAQAIVTRGQLEGRGYIEDLAADERGLKLEDVFSSVSKPPNPQYKPQSEAELYAEGCASDLYD